jgi:hypothetical protein
MAFRAPVPGRPNPPRPGTRGHMRGVNRRRRVRSTGRPGLGTAGAGQTARFGRGRYRAVRQAGRGGHHARPGLIGRLVDRRPDRRRQPGARLRRGRPMRSGHIPGERENDADQHRPDGRGEPRPTAGTEEPSRSRPSMHGISPWHGSGAYHHGGTGPTRVIGG